MCVQHFVVLHMPGVDGKYVFWRQKSTVSYIKQSTSNKIYIFNLCV